MIRLVRVFILSILSLSFLSIFSQITLNTLYGDFTIEEPLLIDLLNEPYMNRLKKVRQYGLRYYIKAPQEYTRYEHSVGVFALLRRYNASILEQAAGLYHDISHTAFSHLGDVVFNHMSEKSSYQDDNHIYFLEHMKLDKVLARYNITINQIIPKNHEFKALEQDLPDLCADRIEYNLHGGLIENLLTKADIDKILKNLEYKNERWYFTFQESAEKLAYVSLYLTEHIWSDLEEHMSNYWAVKAIHRAVRLQTLTYDDIRYSTDDKVWSKLLSINDKEINELLKKIFSSTQYFKITQDKDYDIVINSKFRGVNPLIKVNNKFKRLTELNSKFAKEFHRVKSLVESKKYIKFISQQPVK